MALTHEFKAASVSSREVDSMKSLWKRLKSDAKIKNEAERRKIRKMSGGECDVTLSPKSKRIKNATCRTNAATFG